MVQGLRSFFLGHLHIDLRETQPRGMMYCDSSVFIDYVKGIWDAPFLPNIEHWESEGLDRFLEWRRDFYVARDMVAVDLNVEEAGRTTELTSHGRDETPPRRAVQESRIIRNSALGRFLKSLYLHRCQICRFTFTLAAGRRYAETHHIRPLGREHKGIDKETNMIVLCPNHHSMMDYGAIAIHPDRMTVIDVSGAYPEPEQSLQLMSHSIDRDFLEYHMERIFGKV